MFLRWITLVVYAVIGAVIVYLVHPLLLPIGAALERRVGTLGSPVAELIYGAIVAAVIVIVSTMYTAHWRHVFKVRYPSWMWAVVLGCVLCKIFEYVAGQGVSTISPRSLTIIPLGTILIGAALGLTIASLLASANSRTLTKPSAPISPSRHRRKADLDLNQLEAWASLPEAPVDVLHDDLFGHRSIADRMARHISDFASSRSIGLVGQYGSGKTSVLHAVENLLFCDKKHRFIVAWVHSWGASSGTAAAELILRAVLSELSRYVDCLALSDVPSTYRAALDQSGWPLLMAALSLVPTAPQAEATLKRVDEVLGALGKHLVIFLEDLDRNEFEDARFGEVQALLNRLKQSTKHISFVLAISEEARSQFDFAKICDRYEIIGDLTDSAVEETLKAFTITRLRQYPKDVIWMFDREHRSLSAANITEISIPKSVVVLLKAPRILRTTLRIVLRAWPRLHGEVDIMEFLAVTSLRFGAPNAFQFLMSDIRSLRGKPLFGDSKKHGEQLTKRWEEANVGQPPYLIAAGHDVISYLFPMWNTGGTMSSHTPQTIRSGPHAGPRLVIFNDDIDYWQRMFAEEVDGLRDQNVARTVLRWKKKRSPSKLFKQLANSEVFGERFERLVSASRDPAHPLFLSERELYELAGDFHRLFLSSKGVAADLRDVPEGFYAIWRQLLNRNLGDRHVDWVFAEIDGSLDTSLRFALDVEHWWTDRKAHPEWQRQARQHLVKRARSRIEEKSGHWLANVLDPMFLWTIHHLVRHHYDSQVFTTEEWTWIVAHLRHLMDSDVRFVPHVACLVSKDIETADEDERGRPTRERTWLLDRDYLNALIPDSQERTPFVTQLVKWRDFPNIDGDTQSRLRYLQADIDKFLSEQSG